MPKPTFATALAAELRAAGVTQAALADAVGMAQNTVSRWIASDGFAPTDPAVVFTIERFLGLDGGALSKYLGYLPLGGAVSPSSTVDAINSDPKLTDERREALLGVYKTFTSRARSNTRSMAG